VVRCGEEYPNIHNIKASHTVYLIRLAIFMQGWLFLKAASEHIADAGFDVA
jgi:hypothetical protein